MREMSPQSACLFGVGAGAWLNIWPVAFHPLAGFVFAYIMLFVGITYYVLKERRP